MLNFRNKFRKSFKSDRAMRSRSAIDARSFRSDGATCSQSTIDIGSSDGDGDGRNDEFDNNGGNSSAREHSKPDEIEISVENNQAQMVDLAHLEQLDPAGLKNHPHDHQETVFFECVLPLLALRVHSYSKGLAHSDVPEAWKMPDNQWAQQFDKRDFDIAILDRKVTRERWPKGRIS